MSQSMSPVARVSKAPHPIDGHVPSCRVNAERRLKRTPHRMGFCSVALIVMGLGFCSPHINSTHLILGDSTVAYASEWTSAVEDDAPLRIANAIPGMGLREVDDYWVPRIEQLGRHLEPDRILVSLGS